MAQTNRQCKLIPKSGVIENVEQLYNLLLSMCWLYEIDPDPVGFKPWNLSLTHYYYYYE